MTNGNPGVSAGRRLAPTVEGFPRSALAKYENGRIRREN
jgi:hypothetical protein